MKIPKQGCRDWQGYFRNFDVATLSGCPSAPKQSNISLVHSAACVPPTMAENTNTDQQVSTLRHPEPLEAPDSGHDPPPISIASDSHDPQKEDPDTSRQPKRRKNSPKALDNIRESANFNFTFDTKFNGCTLQFTPKFGSFNLLELSEKKIKEGTEQQEQKEEEEEGEVALIEGREVVSSLRTVDEVKGVE
ncbi:hypothetical protein CIPAW_09G051700 [Carya illinoinensis]|uniref:Uncharacterized protein n=2 Tax=Carya illinoinensis TaxID=32201 RepID=A0A8T1PAP4_CARIL|nr:hypothetical protein CIPAW_09G051700 [Carya illinoinensis]